jgi:hypothetical protein
MGASRAAVDKAFSNRGFLAFLVKVRFDTLEFPTIAFTQRTAQWFPLDRKEDECP